MMSDRQPDHSRAIDHALPSVNGVALPQPNAGDEALRERAWSELLRQEAVRQGLLPAHAGLEAPELCERDQEVIQDMLERTVKVPAPTEQECRRYYQARASQFVQDAQAHVRHILFAVTGGVDVNRLVARAEQALLELSRPGVAPRRFDEMARELSNCPSGADGGDLGWLAPHDCVDELAKEVFHQNTASPAIGLRRRLVASRFGFHIIEVLACKPGRQAQFEEVHSRIAVQLARLARARALHQYMQLLAGQADIEGVPIAAADSPLVQ